MGSSSSKNANEYESQIKARYATEMNDFKLTDNQKKLFDGNAIIEWYGHFKKTSDCKTDGVPGLSKKKFTMLYQRFYPNSKIELFASLMFDHLDADQSGAIDFVEFYQVIIVTELSLDQQVVNMVFNGADKNNNAHLEPQEVADLMIAVYEMGGLDTRKATNQPQINDILSKMAATGDIQSSDQLTLDEWRKLIERDEKLKSAFMHFGFKATN